jgi:hypothetical protein
MLHAPCSMFLAPCSLLHAHVPCRAPCSAPCSAPCCCSCPVHTPSGAACQPSACAAPPPALPPRQGKLVDSSAAPSVDDRLLVPIAEVTCGSQPSTTSNTHCHPGTRPGQGGPRPALLWVLIQPLLANEGPSPRHTLAAPPGLLFGPTHEDSASLNCRRAANVCSAAGKLRMCNAPGSCDVYFEFANVPALRAPP